MTQSTHHLRFGLFLGQVGQDWRQVLENFRLAEELGFDHAWLVDHFVDTDGDLSRPCLEAWTLLAAVAASTSRIRIGALVSGNTYRNPALLLKQAVSVDHISGGRLMLGIGSGWHEPEHRMYGFPFPPAAERVSMLEEALQVMDLLQTQERATYEGRYYQLDDAPFEPKPVQRPRIPVVIGAHRPRMLRLAARHADMWDTFPTIPKSATDGMEDDVADRVRIFERVCREEGRDPAEVRRSTWTGGDVLHSPEAYRSFVDRYRPLGHTDFISGLPAPGRRTELRYIAQELLPALRAEASAG